MQNPVTFPHRARTPAGRPEERHDTDPPPPRLPELLIALLLYCSLTRRLR
jgi:hypothetical protein